MKMIRRLRQISFVLLLVCSVSCGKDDGGLGLDREFIIEPEFQEYVNKFFEEAELLGKEIPKNNLEVLFVDQVQDGFCGFGYSNYGIAKNARVEILDSENCWHSRTPLEKENFLFHELGHALLFRGHQASTFDNEYPSSIMCSSEELRGALACDNYQTYYQTGEMRSYYIEELFNGLNMTAKPSWTVNQNFTRELFKDSIGSDIDLWETFGDIESAELFLSSSLITGYSNALAISFKESTTEEVEAGWSQRFEIDDFQDCSFIKARARIRTNSSFSSTFQMGLSLQEQLGNRELNQFMFHRIHEKSSASINDSEWMELDIYCVPDRSEAVTISFMLLGNVTDTVYVDDVQVELWD